MASAYAESALGLSKALGDLAGPCMFAVTMGISRIIFGKYGKQLDLMKFMGGSAYYVLSAISFLPCHLIRSLDLSAVLVCGFSVGIMWRDNQYFLNVSKGWDSYVLSPCHGRRFRWQYRAWNCWPYHPERRK